MPRYEHRCDRCGEFEQVRPFAEAAAAATCPRCGAAAERVFCAPSLRQVPAPLAATLDRAGRSADAPVRVVRDATVPAAHRHGHRRQRPWQIGH
jgi:putative FmdB family regulatory protein